MPKNLIILITLTLVLLGPARILPAETTGPQEATFPDNYPDFFESQGLPIDSIEDLAPLFEAIGERRFVLLGESSHGTHEYYRWRDLISRHLIEEKGFRFVGVEGDWQAIYRFNDYVKHRTPEGVDARTIMREQITRWPRWMWANEEWAEFLEWLREYNADLPEDQRAGVFGLDMQDPGDSMKAIISWFEENDTGNLERVQGAYQPFRQGRDSFVNYARSVARGGPVLDQQFTFAVDTLREHLEGGEFDKVTWAAKQNALAVKRSEAQYRAMVTQGPDSWNVRATHMHETFQRLAEIHGPESRGIVWAHNTHVGDSGYTDMVARGEVNIGHLTRQATGEDNVYILGFSTSRGSVVAARSWGDPMEVISILPPRPGTFESQISATDPVQVLYQFGTESRTDAFLNPAMHRAIGVIYNPPGEAWVNTILSRRYDALLHIEETTPLNPVGE